MDIYWNLGDEWVFLVCATGHLVARGPLQQEAEQATRNSNPGQNQPHKPKTPPRSHAETYLQPPPCGVESWFF